MSRDLLPNEVILDIVGKTKEVILIEAMNLIDNYNSILTYEYELPDKELFYSWVKSDGLRK